VINFPIDTPVSGVEMSSRPLIEKLFANTEYLERYYKVDKKHKRPIMGTGLGLSIAKKLLKWTMANMGLNLRKGRAVFFGLK